MFTKDMKIFNFINSVGNKPRTMMALQVGAVKPNYYYDSGREGWEFNGYIPEIITRKIDHVKEAQHNSRKSIDTINFMNGLTKCLKNQPIITPPMWASPDPENFRHNVNGEIYVTSRKSDSVVRPGRWFTTEASDHPLFPKHTEIGCINPISKHLHQLWHLKFPSTLSDNHKQQMIDNWNSIDD